jgi:hypothetical protein
MSADNSVLDLVDGLGLTYHFLVTQESERKRGVGTEMTLTEARYAVPSRIDSGLIVPKLRSTTNLAG